MEENKYSPMMRHYLDMKARNPEPILMYRLGDFYEMFFDDAIKASKILDLTLTGRDCGRPERAPMCGVPYRAADNYIARLLAAGEKVAICEQLSDPRERKGMVVRDIVRIITPGTNTIEEMVDGTKNNYLAAVSGSKQDRRYAVALLDILTGDFRVRPFDGASFAELEDYLLNVAPTEIIASSEICSESAELESIRQERLVKFTPVQDYGFDCETARAKLIRHFAVYGLGALGLEAQPVATSALGALLEYVETTQKRDLGHISTPKLDIGANVMHIDFNTRKNLELTETLSDGKRRGSLIWVIDRTKTGMGARLLRNWLLRPLRDANEINARLSAVAELKSDAVLRMTLGETLANIKDLDRYIARIAYGSITPRGCVELERTLRELPSVSARLRKMRAKLFVGLKGRFVDLEPLRKRIAETIDLDFVGPDRNGGYIRAGFSAELDKLNEIRLNAKGILGEYADRQRESTGIPGLKIGYNQVFGYYIEIPKSRIKDDMPADYVRRQTLVGSERYVTDDLMALEKEILTAYDRGLELECKLFAELKERMFRSIRDIKADANAIAELDAIYSLACVADANDYVRPKISSGDAIRIKDGRHPVVECMLKANEFVPNDTILDKEGSTAVITGPNMAGKSTYIRQVATIALLAHIGSFVPASEAEICVLDRIFTRVGASDNLVRGQSTYMVEMLEMSNILRNATDKSLLVLDEIGRGTSTLDGLSIAWAILEHILLKIGAKTLFATHYHELCELEKTLDGIRNYRVLAKETESGVDFLYRISRGGANRSFGIEVAKIAGIEDGIIRRAKDILAALTESCESNGTAQEKIRSIASAPANSVNQLSFFVEDETYGEIKKILRDIDLDRCTPLEALTILADIKRMI